MLDKKVLEELKARLLLTKAELEKEMSQLGKPVDMGDDIDSYDEEADEAVEFSANLGMIQTLKKRYQKVINALSKMEKNEYGVCEICSQDLSLEMLKDDPESGLCQNCKLEKRPK